MSSTYVRAGVEITSPEFLSSTLEWYTGELDVPVVRTSTKCEGGWALEAAWI
jgi:hypothetical protein